jgi:flagella basal body P-ring formation protein FlgA
MKSPVFCALAAVACTCAMGAPRVSIELLPQAEVAGEAVSLGQVAHLRSSELPLMRRLVDLPIGRVPRGGQPAPVRREALAQWIQRETGLAPAEIAWQGTESVQVVRAIRRVGGSEIAAAATQALLAWMAERGIPGEAGVSRWPRDLEVPARELQLRPRSLEGATLRNRMLVWVDVWSEAGFVRTLPVAVDVAATPGTGGSRGAVVPPLGGQASTSPLLVERGGWATLRSRDGVVALESKVAVLQDGREGDHVRVRAPGGGGIVFARVVGAAQLELAP